MAAAETTTIKPDLAVGEHRDLLDVIDSLRSQGVSHYVDLPEIIACGDQSAGKSSILNAISGMPFPTKDSLCTRFPTELVLRRGSVVPSKASIIPSEKRYGDDKEKLECWQFKATIEKEGLGAVMEEATSAMAKGTNGVAFFEDILRIELTGPEQPHLTLVDLPGLFRQPSTTQSEADVVTVRSMVEEYMSRPRSIILAVVSAKSDHHLQDVIKMAKDADTEGSRTMGLITKPDTLDVGSELEKSFVQLARNIEVPLHLGWHVLKNRSFDERQKTSAERDEIEKSFFSTGVWASIDPLCFGVAALRVRLSNLLRDQILAQLPNLVQDVQKGISDCAERLLRLGPVRGNPQQQLTYLLRVSEDYTSMISQAVEGIYNNPFFGNFEKLRDIHVNKFPTRLRAVVQNRLREFADEIRLNGHTKSIEDPESDTEDDRKGSDRPHIKRSDYVADVAKKLKFSKGRELPGLFNPLIVSDLFSEQCKPWAQITETLVDDILEATHITTDLVVDHVTASDVAEGVRKFIRQGIDELKLELDATIDTLLASAAKHPITYNPQLTEHVHRARETRVKRHFKKLICETYGPDKFNNKEATISVNPLALLDQIVGSAPERNMELYGAALAVDYMEAYYKVAMSRFVDTVSTLAIEGCLIDKLSILFRSGKVLEMTDEERAKLAGETEVSAAERKRLEAKRATLEKGLQSLKGFHQRRTTRNVSEDSTQVPETTPRGSEKQSYHEENVEDSHPTPPRVQIPPHSLPSVRETSPVPNHFDILARTKGKKSAKKPTLSYTFDKPEVYASPSQTEYMTFEY